ncbi:MAG: hypothetical protein LBO74_05725 [Candidatus Symbiothrix sp.]|jgi:uncharacterized GH25 family protein|nr:hypothetical protein [Candidatus Symbiothrix sp.]
MPTVKAYYNGEVFVPVNPLDIQKGKVFILSVLQTDKSLQEARKKIIAFRQITNNLHKINVSEPLSPEFDEILSQRTNFKSTINL